MVDQPEYGTNRTYFIDSIEFYPKVKLLNLDKISDFYLNQGRSASQIARHFGVSKTSVLTLLHRKGIRLGTGQGRLTNPKNYRHHVAPFGYGVRDGRLAVNRKELRVCRSIVILADKKGLKVSEIVRELEKLGFKNRAGNSKWDHKAVKKIYERWKDKL